MLKLSVCIELLFAERDFLDRIPAVAEAGLSAFEIWGWKDKDLDAIIKLQKSHGLTLINLNLDPVVPLLHKNVVQALAKGVRESCRVARQLECPRLTMHLQNVPWGIGQPWYSFMGNEKQMAERRIFKENIVATLKEVSPIAQGEGITLILEPLNTLVDHGGYFLSSSQEAVEIIGEVDSPAVRLLYDVYHQQITEGNLINNITNHIDFVEHIHIADVPGRHEPGTGEINFVSVLKAVRKAGYNGYVGLEYSPTGDSLLSLKHIMEVVEEVNRD